MIKARIPILLLFLFHLAGPAFHLDATAQTRTGRLVITGDSVDSRGFLEPIPVYITGFSSDAASVLRHDLLFMAFKSVSSEKDADFLIAGKNSPGRVEVRVIDKFSKEQVYAKAYSGSNERTLIHAIADGIATTITGKPGIAQKKIVFRTETQPRISEIFIADYDGYNYQQVTRDSSWTVAPAWRMNSGVDYVSYKLGNPKIFSHILSTGSRSMITPFRGSNISPSLSPDGTKLAMILSKDGNPELYVGNANGTGLRRLTRTRESESSPCWSPDSREILFVSRKSGQAALYTISANGGAMKRIKTAVGTSTEPDWSPDGKWIIFTGATRSGFNLYLIPAEGGIATPLCLGEDPSWAANSRAVIFARGPDHAKTLSLLDVPTKQVKDIRRISRSNSQPSWAK